MKKQAWQGFHGGNWEREIDVRNFVQTNYTPYEGGAEFLAPATDRTNALMKKLDHLLEMEREFGGVLDIDTRTVTSLTSYKPGYLDKEQEIIVGLQTDRPLRRGINPFGGLNMTRKACEAYGYQLSPEVEKEFQYRTTHNGAFFAPIPMKSARLGTAASSPVCRTHTEEGASSVTTAESRSTVSIGSSRRRKRTRPKSARV